MYVIIFALILIGLCFAIATVAGWNIIFLILASIAVAAWYFRNKSIKENLNKVSEEALHVVNLEKGGVFELHGVGEDYKDLTLTVLAKHLYQEGDFSWFELECDKGTEEKVWVEVEDDDETLVSVVLEKTNKLSSISVTPEKLKQIDDEEAGYVNGYTYSDSGSAVFYRFCDSAKAEKFYYWDFEKGNKCLSVEKWGDNDYEIYISQKMKPSQIRILRNKE